MPLSPILLYPAFRHGAQTPWGGDKLRELLLKDAPPISGESLELSVLPGAESRDGQGRTLRQLIELHGHRLTGSDAFEPFPLLIKLIDARERLSVQVHPDDAYAGAKHGKPGKNEAWFILQAEPGARLILGLDEGVGLERLEQASSGGGSLDSLLRKVPVEPGDAFFIPAGTVHAIGGGILLYEVQQSSDLTYRLYDWGRTNENGRGRELHITDSLNVARPEQRPEAAVPLRVSSGESGQVDRLLDTPFFRLDRLGNCRGLRIMPDTGRFSALTALDSLRLDWEGGSLRLVKGQTALLPADGYPLSLTGKDALLAAPSENPE